MANDFKISDLNDEERDRLIEKLVEELPVLRTKLGISQDELAYLLGISRQTYSSIETKKRKMSWNIYLSLILFLDYSDKTHNFIRKEGVFPKKLLNEKSKEQTISSFVPMENDDIKNHLDEQAIHAIETVIMVEYARCNNLSGEAVIKAFDGKKLTQVTSDDIKAEKALSNIRNDSNLHSKA